MATEKRLIDANAMREDWLENGENEYVYDTNAVLASIDAQPTVDAVEVVHGFWTAEPPYFSEYCSVCGYCPDKKINHNYKYCPNCGANMMDGDGNG